MFARREHHKAFLAFFFGSLVVLGGIATCGLTRDVHNQNICEAALGPGSHYDGHGGCRPASIPVEGLR